MSRKYESIQWVIDALGRNVVEKLTRDPHKYDEVRADQDISWCPNCERKWNWYDGKVWSSADVKLWKEQVCPNCGSQ